MTRWWVGVVVALASASAWAEGTEDPEEPALAPEQPALTSGGLYTLETYPAREPERPLTMTRGITELAVSLGADVSNKTAFDSGGGSASARYGIDDNATVFGGGSVGYSGKAFEVHAGFEGALAWDVIDVRAAVRFGRAAYASKLDGAMNPIEYEAEQWQLSLDLGVPVRYTPRPEVSVIALETLISFDALVAKRGTPPEMDPSCHARMADSLNCLENGRKPDLVPSLSLAVAPIPQLSLVTRVQLQIRDFDTANELTLPALIRARVTPAARYDVGLELELLDLHHDALANRFLRAFVQARF